MDANQIGILVTAVIGSGSISSLVTAFLNKGKYKAENQGIMGKVYGDLIDDCRAQLNHQANQIAALQNREVEYMKIISGHQEIEKELRLQIKSLETRLGNRIKNLEQTEHTK
jgi:hypothetical protein